MVTKLQEVKDMHGQWQNVQRENLQVEGWSFFAGVPTAWPPSARR